MEKTIEITEDYVSFEIAKLLKEKGFDIPDYYCNRVYSDKGTLQGVECVRFKGVKYISAPTLQMAMKWLREVHNCHIYVQALITTTGFMGYCPFCTNDSMFMWENVLGEDYATSPTYEEACEAAIKYCLENLI